MLMPPATETLLPVRDYDLEATMASGQVFSWERSESGWSGVLSGRWVRLQSRNEGIQATVAIPQTDWRWLTEFLQTGVELSAVLGSFPGHDPHLREAVESCRGLRLLRQDPWECLASFILSSTKQIVQIRQIVRALCERHGTSVMAPPGTPHAFAFPRAERIAALTETELRACKMGFRAKYLLAAARRVSDGELNLEGLRGLPLDAARNELVKLAGVGGKIADCVLLFAYGFPSAFPIDVWVARALSRFYFNGQSTRPDTLRHFATAHFGPHAGYAQQYLFHHIRTRIG